VSTLKPSCNNQPSGTVKPLLVLLKAALLPSTLALLALPAAAEPEPQPFVTVQQHGGSAAQQLQAIETEIAQQQLLQPLTDRVTFHQQNEPDSLFEIRQGGIAMPGQCNNPPCQGEDRP
jgi:hypothetical protein